MKLDAHFFVLVSYLLEVKDEHLRHYHATVLSKGTRDQLYLAMRFGLIYEYLESTNLTEKEKYSIWNELFN